MGSPEAIAFNTTSLKAVEHREGRNGYQLFFSQRMHVILYLTSGPFPAICYYVLGASEKERR